MSYKTLTLAELCRKIHQSYNHLLHRILESYLIQDRIIICSFTRYIRIVNISYTALLRLKRPILTNNANLSSPLPNTIHIDTLIIDLRENHIAQTIFGHVIGLIMKTTTNFKPLLTLKKNYLVIVNCDGLVVIHR